MESSTTGSTDTSRPSPLEAWIEESKTPETQFATFVTAYYDERAPPTTKQESYLRQAIVSARLSPEFLASVVERLGWASALKQLIEAKLPSLLRIRRGTFGEVVIGKILEEMHAYTIPIWKDRYLVSGDQTVPGPDGLALRVVGGVVSELCYYEVKLRTKDDKNAPVQGYNQLLKDVSREVPLILAFVLARMHESKHALLEPLLNFLELQTQVGRTEVFYLGLVWEKRQWSGAGLSDLDQQRSHESTSPALSVLVVRIQDVGRMTDSVYKSCGCKEVVEDG